LTPCHLVGIMAVMSATSKPSFEELAALVLAQQEQIARLTARIADLEAQLRQNSKNSSKPPSSDSPFVKPASLRAKGKRRPGRPGGQPGAFLEQVAESGVSRVVVHEPEECGCCGAGLADAIEVGREARQVFDLPDLALEVTEHQVIARRCACGQVTRGRAPQGVSAPASYGPRIAGLAVGLWHGQFLAKARVAEIMAQLFGAPMAPGTVASMATRLAAGLGDFQDAVRREIIASGVVHFDETGFRVEASLMWVHSACTGKYSLLIVHPKRGRAAMDAMGVLPLFRGTAQHDAWAPYDTYTRVTHALCASHLLRELIAVTESGTGGTTGTIAMAQQAITALLNLKALTETAHRHGRTPDAVSAAEYGKHLRSAALVGSSATAARASAVERKHHALFTRITRRHQDYRRFAYDPAIDFDNNEAEREIRMCKLRIKVSGSMRSLRGATEFCLIRSYLQTTRKHGIGWLDALTDAARGIPWMPPALTT
jgi:transposase